MSVTTIYKNSDSEGTEMNNVNIEVNFEVSHKPENEPSIAEAAKQLSFKEQLKKLKLSETPDLGDRKACAEFIADSLNDRILAGYKQRAEHKNGIMRDGKLKDAIIPDPNTFQHESYFIEGETYRMRASSINVGVFKLSQYCIFNTRLIYNYASYSM